MRRCNQCILPETILGIRFDEKESKNFLEKIENYSNIFLI